MKSIIKKNLSLDVCMNKAASSIQKADEMNNPAASGRGIWESILFRRKRRGIYPKEIKIAPTL